MSTSTPIPETTDVSASIEAKFKAPDGSIDVIAAQSHLQAIQARGDNLTNDEIREAIQLLRILRRTNTGPASSRKKAKAAPTVIADPDNLLDL